METEKIALVQNLELLELLGKGLSSEVYKALRHNAETDFADLVAVKIFKSNFFRKKFQSELKNLSKIQHPNIVKVKAWGPYKDSFFLATEYVFGRDLENLKQKLKALDLETRQWIANSIFDALLELKRLGLAHGDLKPSNILCSIKGDIKLIDISLDDIGQIYATPETTAPEVLTGERPDFRSDLYSFGHILKYLHLEPGNLLSLNPGSRSFKPYKIKDKECFQLKLSDFIRSFINHKQEVFSTQLNETLELKSDEYHYNSIIKNKHKKSKIDFNSIILFFLFLSLNFQFSQSLPKVYNLKLRALKSYEFWDQSGWVPLPVDKSYFVSTEADRILLFRRDKKIKKVIINESDLFDKNLVIDAL